MHDLIIIGAGPAGLTASIYASRYNLKHLVFGFEPGGTIALAHQVDNYPGMPGVTGRELGVKFVEHAKLLGATIEGKEVVDLVNKEDHFEVKTSDNQVYESKALILATGTKRRELGVPGEKELMGKGVSYCPTCDAPFFKGKTVTVIGGADAACSGAVHLSKFAHKVYLIYRKDKFRAEPIWTGQIEASCMITPIFNSNIIKIFSTEEFKNLGQTPNTTATPNAVGGIQLDKQYEGSDYLAVDGVFVEIGGLPSAALAEKLSLKLDPQGYIETGENMETSVHGVYCVGDVGSHWREFQQVISASAEGSIAAYSAYKYLQSKIIAS